MHSLDLLQPLQRRGPTVLVVDPDWSTGRRMADSLEGAGFTVLKPVHSAREALDQATRYSPDVIVMDVKLDGGGDGINAARAIARRRSIPVVYVTHIADRETIRRAASANASGFVLKPCTDQQLISAVVLAAHAVKTPACTLECRSRSESPAPVPPSVDVRSATRPAVAANGDASPLRLLTPREMEIVRALALGSRVAGIARQFGLSSHTVRNHLRSIFFKLSVHSQHDVVELWRQWEPAAVHV